MPNMKQSKPSDATDAFIQPDWNSKYGTGVAVPSNRDAKVNFGSLYTASRAGEKARRA